MSNPDASRDYSDYYWGSSFDCPFCGAEKQEGEDLGDSPAFLSFQCCECDKIFSCDTCNEIFYDENGNKI